MKSGTDSELDGRESRATRKSRFLNASRFQVRQGYFITRSYLGGLKHKLPFFRRPQAAYLLTAIGASNTT